jgi:small subunit ribosomal protein S4e
MDVVDLETGQAYRLVPKDSELLAPVPVPTDEKNTKLVKVASKVTIKGKKTQYGFHDGKTLISDKDLKVGDTCVIDLPKVQIKDHIPMDKGSLALIIAGENAGKTGNIDEIKDGIFSLPRRALVSFEGRSVELPVDMVMVVGRDSPIIKVN